ncbi:MAG: globin domain-containing protein [Phycisphaerae bacterium]
MEEATIQRLEKSFQLLAPRGPELVDRFYAHMFSKNPVVREMFPDDMAAQKKKLLASLVLVIQNLRKAEMLRSALIDMGRRHVGYGTEPEHYPIVRDTLLCVMSEMAGEKWNEQLTEDWKNALNFVAAVMIEGQKMEQAQPTMQKTAD